MEYTVVDDGSHKADDRGQIELATVASCWTEWQGVFSQAPFQLAGVARLLVEITETRQGAVVGVTSRISL